MVKTLRDFAARQRSTIVSLEKVLSLRALKQKERAELAFEVAADVIEGLMGIPLEHDGYLEKVRKERNFLLQQVFDAKKQRERADQAERQLVGATEEIRELQIRITAMKEDGTDPLEDRAEAILEATEKLR